MRIHHFALLFLAVMGLIFTAVTVVLVERQQLSSQRRRYEKALEVAAGECAGILKRAGDSGVYGVRDKAVEALLDTLASKLDTDGSEEDIRRLEMHVPMVMICEEEGYYVWYSNCALSADGQYHFVREWTERLPYDDEWPTQQLDRYCNRYNEVAKRLNLSTEFRIPKEEGAFFRACTKKGVYVFFQGEGAGMLYGRPINCHAFAETGIVLAEKYYINTSGEGYASSKYYHKESCGYRGTVSVCYISCEECARQGAYACPCCFNCPDYSDVYLGSLSNRN